MTFDDSAAEEGVGEPGLYDGEEFRIDLAEVASRIEADTTPRRSPPATNGGFRRNSPPRCGSRTRHDGWRRWRRSSYSGSGLLQAFCDTLLTARRPVRIAFLGDSFVEGDILTADLRERLKAAFGGRPGGGTGFAPMASPLTAFRRTVKAQAKAGRPTTSCSAKAAPEFLTSASMSRAG